MRSFLFFTNPHWICWVHKSFSNFEKRFMSRPMATLVVPSTRRFHHYQIIKDHCVALWRQQARFYLKLICCQAGHFVFLKFFAFLKLAANDSARQFPRSFRHPKPKFDRCPSLKCFRSIPRLFFWSMGRRRKI